MNTKKISWDELINSNKENIYLVGYGSLLNENTHHSVKDYMEPVRLKGYKRIFSLSVQKDKCEDGEHKKRFERSAKICREDYKIKENQLSYIENSGAFEVIQSEEHELNGLLLKIERKDFEGYASREEQYELHNVEVEFYSKKFGEVDKGNIYILVRPELKNDKPNFYYLYQKTCRIGAYRRSVDFGKMYDETTYSHDHRLAYEELNSRIFKPGKKYVIRSNLVTIAIFPEKSEEMTRIDGQEVILIENYKYLSKVLILETNEEVWLDKSDLSLLEN